MSSAKASRRRPDYPASLTDLHRLGKSAHGHDGSSRIVMVRKTDQRTFASIRNGEEPKLETITRETIETFRGQRTECKITTEKKNCEDRLPDDLIDILNQQTIRRNARNNLTKRLTSTMEFEQECLQAHNEYRHQHGVPPLKLNKEISKHSQQWANHLINKSTLEHSTNKDYGENIFCMSSSNPKFTINGDEPVKNWYEEIKVHVFGVEPKSLASGHFTQVVWKETKELGVGYAKKGGKIIVVGNYYPPGNVIGRFADNVPPVGGFDAQNNNTVATALGSFARNVPPLAGSSRASRDVEADKSAQTKHGDCKSVVNPESKEYKLFVSDTVKVHNDYRRKHGVPDLKHSVKLSKVALEWAEHCAKVGLMVHRPNNSYGENIFCMYSSDYSHVPTARDVVKLWYDEIKDFRFGSEHVNHSTLHFTQVLWKGSAEVGLGMAKNNKGQTYVVANYHPRGNIIGQFTTNVPKPKP